MWWVTSNQNVWLIKCFQWAELTCMRLAAGFLLFSKCFCLCCSWTFRAKPEPRIPYTHIHPQKENKRHLLLRFNPLIWTKRDCECAAHICEQRITEQLTRVSQTGRWGALQAHTLCVLKHIIKNHHSTNSLPGLTKMLLVISSFLLKDHKSPIARKWDHLKSQDKKGLMKLHLT